MHSLSTSVLSPVDKNILSDFSKLTTDEVSQNIVALNLHFSSLEYQKVQINQAYPVLALFSDIGGKYSILPYKIQ